MKLSVKRYNTRRTEAVPQQMAAQGTAGPAQAAAAGVGQAMPRMAAAGAAPRPAPAQPGPRPAPAAAMPQPPHPQAAPQPQPQASAPRARAEEMLFETPEDGFGDAPFPTSAAAQAAPAAEAASDGVAGDIESIRREGLTGRQLRMARRMAQKYGLPATSDFDAVRLLRAAGIDPFQKGSLLEIMAAEDEEEEPRPAAAAAAAPVRSTAMVSVPNDAMRLPQTVKPAKLPAAPAQVEQSHLSELSRIQQDLMRRRRRNSILMTLRLLFFVALPTLLAGIYYYNIATPLYATKTEFVIQQADPGSSASGGGASMLSRSPLATAQDSIVVQGYLMSRDAMLRLDRDVNFRALFTDPNIDPIQRLEADPTDEAAYKVYQRNVRIGFDPTEGVIKMEVIAPDPQASANISKALISYAEEQVDQLTKRLREDQMKGARENYEDAERQVKEAQLRVVDLQRRYKILSSEVEVQLITSQISSLEGQLTKDRLGLAQLESNPYPNPARVEPLKRRIATMETQISEMRTRLTEQDESGGESLAEVQSDLLLAQADVETRQKLLAQSLESMESARIAASQQVRYLSIGVSPIAPDEPTYPRAFENTSVALLIFAGIYLMISMTAAILREQVTA